MRKKILVVMLLLLFALTTVAAAEYLLECPICGNNAVRWTGETVKRYGKTFYVWECTQGHRFLFDNIGY